jgi:hypothetical protein
MPERVLLQPALREYGLYHGQYDALVKELETNGMLVRLLPPDARAEGPAASESYDLTLHLGEVAGAIIGTANLIRLVKRSLRGYGQRRRSAKLYLYNGEEHEFSLDEDDE